MSPESPHCFPRLAPVAKPFVTRLAFFAALLPLIGAMAVFSQEAASLAARESYIVYLSQLRQEVDGFGISTAWTSPSLSDAWADFLFNPATGIGLSLCRNRVGPNDAYDTDMETRELDAVKKAQARGARVWSTPWTPPARWKTNNDITHGGRLLPGRYSDYAERLARYVAELKDQGVNLFAVSVQNEPDLSTGYESCEWSGAEIHDFVPHLRNALAALGVGNTKILLPEASTWTTSLATETMADATTAPLVGIVAAHGYGQRTPPTVDRFGKRLWQTEVADLNTPYDGSTADAIRWASNVQAYLVEQEANAWHWWWAFPFQDDNSGLLALDGRIPKRAYALGNFSRFVRPGYRRVACSGSGSLSLSAFREPGSDRFVVVAINPTGHSVEAQITMPGLSPSLRSVTPWVTSTDFSLTPQADLTIAEAAFTATLPALSVVTFVSSAGPAGVNLRAHHENGQTFLVWRDFYNLPDTETYDVYVSDTPIATLAGLQPAGRIFPPEWKAARLKATDSALTWSVPSPGGLAPLSTDEALFVYTPHSATPAYFAVVPHGQAGLDVGNVIGPVDQSLAPVQCYPQYSGVCQGRPFTDFALWIDGRADAEAGRSDFPVMGNAAFNGLAQLFRVYSWDPPPTAAAKGKLAVWLHDRGESWGGGLAHQPAGGFLLSLDDHALFLTQDGASPVLEALDTHWLGYWEGFDRFDPNRLVPPADGRVVAYTLRRNAWVLEWVQRWLGGSLAAEHVILAGVGRGAAGGDVNLRFRPDLYSAGLFFNGDTALRLAGREAFLYGLGPSGGDGSLLPTDVNGLPLNDLFQPHTRLSTAAETPLKVLVWGVNDQDNPWDRGQVIQGRKPWAIDRLSTSRTGALVFWDQRSHKDWADKAWSNSPRIKATFLTNLRKGESYPVFSAEVHPKSDPYAAMPFNPIADEDGRNWGCRGGFFNWTVDQDSEASWAATLWMTGSSSWPHDVPDFAKGAAEVSIGGDRRFRPLPGSRIRWDLRRRDDGSLLERGECVVDEDGQVKTNRVAIYKDPVRVRLRFSLPPRGDVNTDGAVDAGDVALFAAGVAESATIPSEGWAEADLDEDGTATLRDLVELLSRVVGP